MTFNAHELGGIVAALTATVSTGVLDVLVGTTLEPTTERAIVERSGCDAVALDRVLAVLAAVGAVERDGQGGVRLAEHLRHEAESAPGGLGGLVSLFSGAAAFLAQGARKTTMDGDAATRAAAYSTTVADLGRFFQPSADALAALLPPVRRILDVGAGSGVWSLAMLEVGRHEHADARVTALDLPAVLPSFRARAEARGVAASVDTIEGNYFEVAAQDGGFDRVVLANVLHLESAERACELVARAARACAPGGEVVVIDIFDVGPRGALGHAVYELHLAMRTGGGRAHAAEKIKAWMWSAGLVPEEPVALSTSLAGLGALRGRSVREARRRC